MRVQILDSDVKDPDSLFVVRYLFKGARGAVMEGYAVSPTRNPPTYNLWVRSGNEWEAYTEAEEHHMQADFMISTVRFATDLGKQSDP